MSTDFLDYETTQNTHTTTLSCDFLSLWGPPFIQGLYCDIKGLKTVILDIYTKSTLTHTLNLGT